MMTWHIFEVLNCWQASRPYPPTVRELTRACGLRSWGSVFGHLERLRGLGLVTWEARKGRTLRVCDACL